MTFAEIEALHVVAGDWAGERRLVEHPELEAFSQLTGKFCGALGESAEEGFWGPVVRMLKRARWDAATTPLPLSSPATGLADAAREAVPRLERCKHVAPELAAAAEDLAQRLTALAACNDDPLGDAMREALGARLSPVGIPSAGERLQAASPLGGAAPTGNAEGGVGQNTTVDTDGSDEAVPAAPPAVAVLLRNGRYLSEVEPVVAALGVDVSVITSAELMTSAPLDVVAAIGPAAWFPAPVVRAPRAAQMIFIYPAWIRDAEPQSRLLAGSGAGDTRSRISRAPARATAPFDDALPLTPAEDWVPSADWKAISAAGRRRIGEDSGSDPVQAWLFALASGDGVYLEAGEGSRAYIVELDEDVSIRQELTSQIEIGDFVVLRTEGEGDYIRPIADSILGRNAQALREMQAGWKREFAEKMNELGSRGLRRALDNAGAVRATDNNIRQWLRPDTIRPRDPADFSAITAVIGARERFRELWDGMGAIDSAHRRAGFQVRALLVEELVGGDRSLLISQGWADFDVEEIEGEGALRVARVEGRAPDTQLIPRTRTRRPFTIGRDLWLE
jgi:hypothetical protein